MVEKQVFCICPKCFSVSDSREECEACEEGEMVQCNVLELSKEQRKPLFDDQGRLLTRAPRWFLEETGVIAKV